MVTSVIKRDGSIEEFNFDCIVDAAKRAYNSYGKEVPAKLFNHIKKHIEEIEDGKTPTVEDILDIMEESLGEIGEIKILRSFIQYRFRRKLKRETKRGSYKGTTLVDCAKTIWEYVKGTDWRVKANANTGYSHAGLINNTAGKVIANFWLDQVFSPEEAKAHREGDIYIHDLDNLSIYCVGHSLRQLLNLGFGIGFGRPQSAPPRHFVSAVNQIVNYLCVLQAEAAGAQAFSSFDTYLAPFIFIDELSPKDTEDILESMVFNLNQPQRWGQSPFVNLGFELTPSDDLKGDIPICADEPLFARYQEVLDKGDVENPLFEKATNLAVKAVKRGKSNLLELTYGDFQPEIEQIVIAFYTVLNKGDFLKSPWTFPIPTLNLTESVNWDSPMMDVIFENAAKMGSSYFQNFLGSQYRINPETGEKEPDPTAFKPGDVRSMCCRLQLDLTQLKKKGGGLFGSGEMTGSTGVVTINFSRLGYVYAGDKDGLYKRLDELLDMALSILRKRRTFCEQLRDRGLYPYTSKFVKSWDTFYNTIGTNGMSEMCGNFFQDKNITTATRQGIDFCKEVLNHIRARLVRFQEETGLLANLEGVPAEGCVLGDTTVWTDKGFIKIKDLVGKKNIHAFSFNEGSQEIELSDVEEVFQTNAHAQVMKITFDNGRAITCTLNHPFAVRLFGGGQRGEYIEWRNATNLKAGDRIKSIYLRRKEPSKHLIFARNTAIHRVVAEHKYGGLPDGFSVHHLDENKLNNAIENIVAIPSCVHKAYHTKDNLDKYRQTTGSPVGEKNHFYGKKHTIESLRKMRFSRCNYTEEDESKWMDAYVNGQLSFAQTGRLFGRSRFQITESVRALQKWGQVTVDLPTYGSPRFNKASIEYLVARNLDKEQIVKVLGGSKLVREKTREYVDFLQTENHKVVKIEYLNEMIPVYNMTVKNNHNYFVSDAEDATDAVLVHNCTYKLAKMDKLKFPKIITAGSGENIYYTNSSQLPVNFTDDPYLAFDLQDELQTLYTGGTVLHYYHTSENVDKEACKKIVKRLLETHRLPYMSMTPTFCVCERHGRLPGNLTYCPYCDTELLEKYKDEETTTVTDTDKDKKKP